MVEMRGGRDGGGALGEFIITFLKLTLRTSVIDGRYVLP